MNNYLRSHLIHKLILNNKDHSKHNIKTLLSNNLDLKHLIKERVL
jgi:hypothetical protein